MVYRVQVLAISADEGNRLLRSVRRSSGSVVTWRRALMVLLSAQGMDAANIAEVTFTGEDQVRDVLHNFNADGFDSLRPKYARGPATEVRPRAAGTDQEDRAGALGRSRAAVLDLEPVEAGRLPCCRGGGRGHLPRGTPPAATRAGRLLSKSSRPARPAPILIYEAKKTGCWSSMPSPTARPNRAPAIQPW